MCILESQKVSMVLLWWWSLVSLLIIRNFSLFWWLIWEKGKRLGFINKVHRWINNRTFCGVLVKLDMSYYRSIWLDHNDQNRIWFAITGCLTCSISMFLVVLNKTRHRKQQMLFMNFDSQIEKRMRMLLFDKHQHHEMWHSLRQPGDAYRS